MQPVEHQIEHEPTFAKRLLVDDWDHGHSCVANLLQTANNGVGTMNNGCADVHIVLYTFLKHGSRDSVDERSPLLKSQIAHGTAVQRVAEFNSVSSQRFERRLIQRKQSRRFRRDGVKLPALVLQQFT